MGKEGGIKTSNHNHTLMQPTDFHRGERQALKRQTKQRKKYTNTIKRIVVPAKALLVNPEQIAMNRSCVKRGSDTEKNLQKTKGVKFNNLMTKMNEGMRNTISKTRQAD